MNTKYDSVYGCDFVPCLFFYINYHPFSNIFGIMHSCEVSLFLPMAKKCPLLSGAFKIIMSHMHAMCTIHNSHTTAIILGFAQLL